jgi:hypothetical protein
MWLYGANEPFEELPNVLLDGHLLLGGQQLKDEFEQPPRELGDKALFRAMSVSSVLRKWSAMHIVLVG